MTTSSPPLGSNLTKAYRALIERLKPEDRFGRMSQGFSVSGSAWHHHDLSYLAKGAPVIIWESDINYDLVMGLTRGIGVGPFEAISEGGVQRNVDGGFYATLSVPFHSVEFITEKEFYQLFMRPWTRIRRFRWHWLKQWT